MCKLASLLILDEEEVKRRLDVCKFLREEFSMHGYPNCEATPFGSSLNGLGFPGSDLDIYMDLDKSNLNSSDLQGASGVKIASKVGMAIGDLLSEY